MNSSAKFRNKYFYENIIAPLMVYFRIIIEQTKKVYCDHLQIRKLL